MSNLKRKIKSSLLALIIMLSNNIIAGPDDYEWIQLFNGQNLDDWNITFRQSDYNEIPLTPNGDPVVRVEDGVLIIEHGACDLNEVGFGHLANEKSMFSYYIVGLEYMFINEQGPNGPEWAYNNNGIMAHSQSMQSMTGDFPNSIEIQLLGDRNCQNNSGSDFCPSNTNAVYQPNQGVTDNLCTPGTMINGGTDDPHCSTADHVPISDNEYVRVEAMVLGDSLIKHIVEGDTVMEYGGLVLDNGTPLTEGYIALQAESSTMLARKMEVLELIGCMDPTAGNYKSYYIKDNPESCIEGVLGCMDENYVEYNPDASVQVDDSCVTVKVAGCTDANYGEYNPDANVHVQDSCVTGVELSYEGKSFGVVLNESELSVSIEQAGMHSIRIYDVNGNLLIRRNGEGVRKYNFNNLIKSGMHFICISTPQGMVEKKVFLF
jgi:hypothetical protein